MRNFSTTPRFDSVSRECSWVAVTSRVNYFSNYFLFYKFFLASSSLLSLVLQGRFTFWILKKKYWQKHKGSFAIKETKIFVVFFEQNVLAESKALRNVLLIFQWVWEKSKYSLPLRGLKSSAAVGGETQFYTSPFQRFQRRCSNCMDLQMHESLWFSALWKIKVLRLLELFVCLREGRSVRSSALQRTTLEREDEPSLSPFHMED